jgi:hypothetical protein
MIGIGAGAMAGESELLILLKRAAGRSSSGEPCRSCLNIIEGDEPAGEILELFVEELGALRKAASHLAKNFALRLSVQLEQPN